MLAEVAPLLASHFVDAIIGSVVGISKSPDAPPPKQFIGNAGRLGYRRWDQADKSSPPRTNPNDAWRGKRYGRGFRASP